jgi:hypothetical protein
MHVRLLAVEALAGLMCTVQYGLHTVNRCGCCDCMKHYGDPTHAAVLLLCFVQAS